MRFTRLSFPIQQSRILTFCLLLLVFASGALAAETSGFELTVLAGEERLAEVESLPIFKVYDGRGEQILNEGGAGSSFRQKLESLITAPPDGDVELTLADELAAFVMTDGSPVEATALPAADFTFVKYWAVWCAPCHKQSKIVKEVIAAHPDIKINVVLVEADTTKTAEQRGGLECSEAVCAR